MNVEEQAHWRALIKPIVIEMHKRKLSRLVINKNGGIVHLNADYENNYEKPQQQTPRTTSPSTTRTEPPQTPQEG